MLATGCLPPVCMVADKATHQRETRQLVGAITLNPGGPELLISVFLGAPKCPRGDGYSLKDSIVSVETKFIKPSEQHVAFAGDGVYSEGHCAVGKKLDEHYQIKSFFTWDQMHLAATVETAVRKLHEFLWLVELFKVIGMGVRFVAWGMMWYHFFQVS